MAWTVELTHNGGNMLDKDGTVSARPEDAKVVLVTRHPAMQTRDGEGEKRKTEKEILTGVGLEPTLSFPNQESKRLY